MDKKTRLTLSLLFLFAITGFSQTNYWKVLSTSGQHSPENLLNEKIKIDQFSIYQLNLPQLKAHLQEAPLRNKGLQSNITVILPVSPETMGEYTIYKVQTLAPEFASKHTDIQSYVGTTKDKKSQIRITLTPTFFFGMVLGTTGDLFINPYTKTGNNYQVFYKKNIISGENEFECHTITSTSTEGNNNTSPRSFSDVNDGNLRSYRAAIATTGEYSQFHINEQNLTTATVPDQKEGVLAAIVVTMDRVNQIYERDLSITMQLIDNEDIIYLNPDTDPFTNDDTYQLIDESQEVIDDNIGTDNYDIGHTFSTGAGGLAQRPAVCIWWGKASGVTGIQQPIGDAYDIDYVAHEIGHQFGASHTFNGDGGSCWGNRNDATAVEPGSGTTIMAYAGICQPQNVQFHSDAQFHAVSIDEIYQNITIGESTCGQQIPTTNTAPVVVPLENYTIPYGTAFKLTTDATDADNDMLTYCWEQTDTEIAQAPPVSTATGGPVYRSLPISESPTRYFPPKDVVLSGSLATDWQVTPTVARTLNFAVTVRDNNIQGGQSTRKDVVLSVADTGPFEITSQNTNGITYYENDTIEITWNVGGTNANFINTQEVSILLSYDNGATFSTTLASNTPNDGEETIQIPNGTLSDDCRIMIVPTDNIYYAVNSNTFSIEENMGINSVQLTENTINIYPNPSNGIVTVDFKNAPSSTYYTRIYDLRGRLITTQTLNTRNSLSQTIQLANAQAGIYLVKITNGKQNIIKKLIIN